MPNPTAQWGFAGPALALGTWGVLRVWGQGTVQPGEQGTPLPGRAVLAHAHRIWGGPNANLWGKNVFLDIVDTSLSKVSVPCLVSSISGDKAVR